MLLGPEAMEYLGSARIIIFGLGGVGSWCAESLIRTGAMQITIVDADVICPTNINRQIQTHSYNIGEPKVFEMEKRLKSINPSANIKAIYSEYNEENDKKFNLASYDYVIDAIDSINDKIFLIKRCTNLKLKFFSSMGAALKTDPSRIKIEKLSNTVNCPLARIVRKAMRKERMPADFLCVYSDELPAENLITENPDNEADSSTKNSERERKGPYGYNKRINGALAHVTGTFGLYLASMVINDAVKTVKNKEKC